MMKPHPSDTLLGPGQRWIITWALGWGVVRTDMNCRESNGKGPEMWICREPAVIFNLVGSEQLCEQHMGYHRWIEDDTVMQWKADPRWIYPVRRSRKYRRAT